GRRRKIDLLGLPLRENGGGAGPASGASLEPVGDRVVASIGGDRGHEEASLEAPRRLARRGLPGVEPPQLDVLEIEARLLDALASRRSRECEIEVIAVARVLVLDATAGEHQRVGHERALARAPK